MDYQTVIRERYSCRTFTDRVIAEDQITELLELVRLTPSALNLQTWRLKVVRDAATKAAIKDAAFGQQQVATCSHLLVLCATLDLSEQLERRDRAMAARGLPESARASQLEYARSVVAGLSPEQRASLAENQVYIALGSVTNGAKSLGIDSCPMTGFDRARVSQLLALPTGIVPVALVPLGYGAGGAPDFRERFTVDELLLD
jgi:nitroreductase